MTTVLYSFHPVTDGWTDTAVSDGEIVDSIDYHITETLSGSLGNATAWKTATRQGTVTRLKCSFAIDRLPDSGSVSILSLGASETATPDLFTDISFDVDFKLTSAGKLTFGNANSSGTVSIGTSYDLELVLTKSGDDIQGQLYMDGDLWLDDPYAGYLWAGATTYVVFLEGFWNHWPTYEYTDGEATLSLHDQAGGTQEHVWTLEAATVPAFSFWYSF